MWKLVLTVLCLLFASVSLAELVDQNESCEFWASIGECKKNPRYMLQSCALSCDRVTTQAKAIPKSFYEIVEKDIHGNEITFDRFKGKVVYVVNVASQCGYTEENYKTFRALQKYYDSGLEIVLAPCNAFGGQEPGSPNDIYHFASRKGFSGIILEKDEVNGVVARPTFQYLKHATGKDYIEWYVVSQVSPLAQAMMTFLMWHFRFVGISTASFWSTERAMPTKLATTSNNKFNRCLPSPPRSCKDYRYKTIQ